MTEKKVLTIFKKEKALLSGHFLLSSGLHSPNYLQCALLLQKPTIAEKLCRALAKKLKKKKVNVVIGPALGGILVSYEVSRSLGVRSIFAERGSNGVLCLRRGFELKKGERALVVEDVVTTGKSTNEVIHLVNETGAKLAAVAAIVDRSGGVEFSAPFYSLLKMDVQTYSPENCPLCKEGRLPAIKPGSRSL